MPISTRVHFVIVMVLVFLSCGLPSGWSCTIITVGKKASQDSSVINCNVSDSRTSRTWLNVIPPRRYQLPATCPIYGQSKLTVSATDLSRAKKLGEIPQVAMTYGYLNPAYPCMNEHQLTVTESTFGGEDTLRNPKALFSCEELCRLIMERSTNAREAIRLIDALTREYGYNDAGETLAIADKKEIWYLEILGCGHDRIGAVWAAQRVPEDHVAVNANGSRILELDLNQPDYFMASANVYQVAQDMGWWHPERGLPFRFAYIYGRASRIDMGTRRREWRVLDVLAPSQRFDPNASDFPFSVKPDRMVTVAQIMALCRDTFEGTEFDMTKNIKVTDQSGKVRISPYANPFMDYDMMPLFHINGGWGARGERPIARYYCNYSIICQARTGLPDAIGGLVWHGFDNPATTVHVPIFIGNQNLPPAYLISGRTGYNRACAWWAFNEVADLAAQRWGDMRRDVDSVRTQLLTKFTTELPRIEAEAQVIFQKNSPAGRQYLTTATNQWCEQAVNTWWQLSAHLWSKYTGKF